MSKGTICVDFDGVIHQYSVGWHDGTIYDPPFPNVKYALQWFIDEDYEVVIFTTRANDHTDKDGVTRKGQYEDVVCYLAKHSIPYTRVYTGQGKPKAKLYIDDRALRFEGNWMRTLGDAATALMEEEREDLRKETYNKMIEGIMANAKKV